MKDLKYILKEKKCCPSCVGEDWLYGWWQPNPKIFIAIPLTLLIFISFLGIQWTIILWVTKDGDWSTCISCTFSTIQFSAIHRQCHMYSSFALFYWCHKIALTEKRINQGRKLLLFLEEKSHCPVVLLGRVHDLLKDMTGYDFLHLFWDLSGLFCPEMPSNGTIWRSFDPHERRICNTFFISIRLVQF